MDNKIKVLYIAGAGRSGTTILGNTLGQIDGFFSAGELCYLWDRGPVSNGLCSCGAKFAECEVWATVLGEVFGDASRLDAHEMSRIQRTSTRPRHLPLMSVRRGKRLLMSRWEGMYRDNLEKLYRAIQRSTGDKVIVDCSKLPLYGYILETMPMIDLYVVHLVRDPRAVAYSWLRKKSTRPIVGGLAHMPQRHPVESSLEWDICNVAVEAFWKRFPNRYMVLRYEDFIEEPRESVRRILDLVQEDVTPLPFISQRGIEFGVNHNIGGNPNRFKTGTVELRPDREWITKIRSRDRRMVTSLSIPLLNRYGYTAVLD